LETIQDKEGEIMVLAAVIRGAMAALFVGSTMFALTVQARAADTVTRTYVITRNGGKIGTITQKITTEGQTVTFEEDTKIDVEKMEINIYQRSNRFKSVWHQGQIESFASETDIQGKKSTVKALRVGDNLEVTANAFTNKVPANSFPNTYWNIAMVNAEHLIDKTTGQVQDVSISKVQPAQVTVGGKNMTVQHYLMTGGSDQGLFYGQDGTWVGTSFRHGDGSLIEIVLQ
jgi:hypothetical protein